MPIALEGSSWSTKNEVAISTTSASSIISPAMSKSIELKINKFLALENVTTTVNTVSSIPRINVYFDINHFRFKLKCLIIILYLGHCPDWYLYGRSIWNEVGCQVFVRSTLGLQSMMNRSNMLHSNSFLIEWLIVIMVSYVKDIYAVLTYLLTFWIDSFYEIRCEHRIEIGTCCC